MPKRHQQHPAKGMTGHNNPEKTTEPTSVHSELEVTHKADSQARTEDREHRSGSDSNADKHRKGDRVHRQEQHKSEPAGPAIATSDFEEDLRPHNFAGADHGPGGPPTVDYSRNAERIKSLHSTLADLTDDELRRINPVAEGSRLEQGATYIDLKHLEQGEFTAQANMVATPDHLYVPKKDTDYVIWNRLNQVDNPRRLDEADNTNG
jgi:hypothetical protein